MKPQQTPLNKATPPPPQREIRWNKERGPKLKLEGQNPK